MSIFRYVLFALFFLSFYTFSENSSDGIWTYIGPKNSIPLPDTVNEKEMPFRYGIFRFDQEAFMRALEKSSSSPLTQANNKISIPRPDGSFSYIYFFKSEVMHPDLEAQNPSIKTFHGVEIGEPSVLVRYDITPAGFHAQVKSKEGLFYVSPLTDNIYISFFASDYSLTHDFGCDVDDHFSLEPIIQEEKPLFNYGTSRRTYRIAIAATGEYTMAVGGTKTLALSSIVTALNFINGIYERDVGVRFQLIPTNSNIIYTDPATDPYTPSSGNITLLNQNQANITSVIGSANYDIGHLVHALAGSGNFGSGVASISAVCRSTVKARGVSTASRVGTTPINPGFYRILIHEMGHQHGANHSFNSSCNGNRNDATAYEPGGGSTIMSYAGGCSPYNVQSLADTYFHRINLQEISNFLAGTGATCGSLTNTGNAIPTAEAGVNYIIPKSTPFVLTGIGTDANLTNSLSYTWEQFNNEIAVMPPLPTSLSGPNFRSFTPASSNMRFFPRMADILANQTPTWEVLPSVSRTMNFSLVVRDNVGGASSDNMTVTFDGNSGPFVVTSPNGGEIRVGNTTVTWNPANTQLPPVNVSQVDILLSLDNGNTFPIILANNTPNDGSQTVLMPAILSSVARIQVKAEGNIFFDISNSPFTIRPLNLLE